MITKPPKMLLSTYRRDRVSYHPLPNKQEFAHNIECDEQLLLTTAADTENAENILLKHAQHVIKHTINWSDEHFDKNKQRLGINPIVLPVNTTLIAFVFRPTQTVYSLSPIGEYQLNYPAGFREEIAQYTLLLTDDITSFAYSAALLFGANFLNNMPNESQQFNDLSGANGWQNFSELFTISNICADWLVLRNGEYLPDDFWGNDKDVDVLCCNLPVYIQAVNAEKRGAGLGNFHIKVENELIDLDARFVGDAYYDKHWESTMLSNKQYQGVVPVLSDFDYFYSLLYHARIHKNVVKPVYKERLATLANKLNIPFNTEVFIQNKLCGEFFNDFFNSNNYQFTYPLDYPCYENINHSVVQYIRDKKPQGLNLTFRLKAFGNKLFLWACSLAPRDLKDKVKRIIKR